jgi:hypothetical protein
MPGENSGNMYVKKPTQTQEQNVKASDPKSAKEIAIANGEYAKLLAQNIAEASAPDVSPYTIGNLANVIAKSGDAANVTKFIDENPTMFSGGSNSSSQSKNSTITPSFSLTASPVSTTPKSSAPVTIPTAVPKSPTIEPVATVKVEPKTAPIDTVLFNDDLVPIELMTDLVFEDIGGQELINISRNDIVNGQQVTYRPIKNLSSIQQQYNPNNILGIQSTSDKYFANFSIKLDEKIPEYPTGPNGTYVYLESGNIVIESINLESDEQVQVQISTGGTIYETQFGA